MAGIYIIENNVNGMVYVGKSTSPESRFKEHQSLLRRGIHSNRLLQKDYDKYGSDSLTYMVIEDCGEEDLYWKELEWIQHYRVFNVAPIYNDRGRTINDVDPKIKQILVASAYESLERRRYEQQ